ncbi:hypothetical protein HDV05_001351, partial [Chytridiales sp. JEL 0842]
VFEKALDGCKDKEARKKLTKDKAVLVAMLNIDHQAAANAVTNEPLEKRDQLKARLEARSPHQRQAPVRRRQDLASSVKIFYNETITDVRWWFIEVDETDETNLKYFVRFLDKKVINRYSRWYLRGEMDFSPKLSERAPPDAYEHHSIFHSGDGKLHINSVASNRPCPKLLKLRAILSKVLRASGRADEIYEARRNMDEDPQAWQTANNPHFLVEVAHKLAKLDRDQTMNRILLFIDERLIKFGAGPELLTSFKELEHVLKEQQETETSA